ncbi:MAG: hypothetical protein ACRDPJ_10815 [Nocardioidaceae bacterium]
MSAIYGPGAPSERDAVSAASRSGAAIARNGASTPAGAAATSSEPARLPASPALADGVDLIGEMEGSGYRTPPALVRRADGQVISLTRLLYLVLAAVDGRRTHTDIADRVSAESGRLVSSDDVATLVRGQLLPLGLLRLADGSEPAVKKANPLLALRFRYVVTDPEVTRRVTAPFALLFNPLLVAALLAAFVAVCGWLLVEKGLASATHQALHRPGLLLAVFAVTVVSAGFHEFGHASAARYGGATPGAMGMGLYLVWPAFYTDVTDSYRLGRAGRLRTDLGGLYFNAIVAVAMFGIWWASGWDALLLIIVTQVLQMLRQLAPLVRFDGYHVLADLTGVPDLYHHIKPTLLGLLPHHWGRSTAQALKPWARAVVSVWVLVVVPVMLLSVVGMVIAFPRVAATAWDSMSDQWETFGKAFAAGDVPEMAVRMLSIVAIALPIFGTVYILVRLLRRVVRNVWRRTEARPAQRAVAVVVALGIVAALAWAWWPDEDRYRAIQAYERGAVQDLVPVGSASPGLAPGRVGRARTLWPAGSELPTADAPALSVVFVPRDGEGGASSATATGSTSDPAADGATSDDGSAGAQTWVFPFDRPAAPAEGDNQALAVNTEDGSTVYDVAFALVWAEEDTTDNVNSAYALASCENCQTVAVAFQVVLVLGQSDAIVPQNLAAAVNYHCIECVTYALATQLVVTLDGPLGDDAAAELEALWRRIAAYGDTIEGVPLSEIQDQLSAFEDQILAIIERDRGGTSTTTREGTGTPPTASPTSSPEPGSGPSSGATDGSSGAETTTGSEPDPRPSTGTSSAPEPSSSPALTPPQGPSPSPSETEQATPSPTTSATP